MAKIYGPSNKVKLKIHDVSVTISALSHYQKYLIYTAMEAAQKKGDPWELGQTSLLSIKFGLKEIEGVEYPDGSKFDLKFDDAGVLTDETLEELQNMEHSPALIESCMQLYVNFLNRDFSEIEGVSLIEGKKQGEIVS